MRQRRFLRYISTLVLVCFLSTLCAPILEAAPVVFVKVPGRQVMFDVNSASAGMLQQLPGIGPKTAAEIVKYRAAHGAFRSLDAMANVPGVGTARLRVLKSAATQAARPDLRMKQSQAGQAQKARVAKAQAEAKARAVQVAKARAEALAKQNAAKVAREAAVRRAADAKARAAVVEAKRVAAQQKVDAQKAAVAKAAEVKAQQARAQAAKARAEAQTRAKALAKAKALQQAKVAEVKAAAKAQAAKGPAAPSSTKASATVKRAAAPAKAAPAPRELWIQGPKTRVNLNNQNTSGLAGALTRAGFDNAQASALLNARIQNGRFAEIHSYAELMGRLRVKSGSVSWLDGAGRFVKPKPQPKPAEPKKVASKQAAKPAPAAPVKTEITTVNGKPVARVTQGSSVRNIDLNGSPNASTLYRQLKAAGVSTDTAKQIAQARIKGKFQPAGDRASATRKPAAPKTEAKPAAPVETRLTQLEKQYNAILNRKPTTEAGWQKTIKSLQDTRAQLAREAGGQTRLKQVDAKIDWMKGQQRALQEANALSVTKARLNTELTEYVRAGREVGSAPAGQNATAIDRQMRGLKQAYDGIFKSLDAQARLSGKNVPAAELVKDPRLAELAKRVDVLKSQKSTMLAQAQKAKLEAQKAAQQRADAKAKPAEPAASKTRDAKADPKARTSMLDRLKAETEARAQQRVTAKAGTPEAALKAKIADLQANIMKRGGYRDMGEVYRASQQPGAKGQLAELGQAIEQLRGVRGAKVTASEPVAETARGSSSQSASEPVAKAADAPKGPQSPQSREAIVRQKAEYRLAKLLESGQFKTPKEAYEAALKSNARGDVKKLQNALTELNQIQGKEPLPVEKAQRQIAEAKKAASEAVTQKKAEVQRRTGAGEPAKTTASEPAVAKSEPAAPKPAGESLSWWDRMLGRTSKPAATASEPVAEPVAPKTAATEPVVEQTGSTRTAAASRTAAVPEPVVEPVPEPPVSEPSVNKSRGFLDRMLGRTEAPAQTTPSEPVAKAEPVKATNWADEHLEMLKGNTQEPKPGSWTEKLSKFLRGRGATAEPAKAAVEFEQSMASETKGANPQESLLARENELRMQAKDLRGRILEEGGFKNTEEVYKASQKPDATGELAKLKAIDSEIQALRSQRHSQTAVGEGPVSESAAVGKATEALPGEQAAGKTQTAATEPVAPKSKSFKFLDWLTGKSGAQPAATDPDGPGVRTAKAEGGVVEPVATEPKAEPTAPKSGGGFFEKLFNWSRGKGFKTTADVQSAKASTVEGLPPEMANAKAINEQAPAAGSPMAQLEETNAQLKDARAKANEITGQIKEQGKLGSIEEIQAKASEPGAKGKLADLKQAQEAIAELNAKKTSLTETIEANPAKARGEAAPGEPAASGTRSGSGSQSEPVASKTEAAPKGQAAEPVAGGKSGGSVVEGVPAEPAAPGAAKGPGAAAEPVAAGKAPGAGGTAPAEPVVAKGSGPGAAVEPVAPGGSAPKGGAVVEPTGPVATAPAGGAVEPVAPAAKAPAGGTAPTGGAVVEPVAPVAKAPAGGTASAGGAVVEPVAPVAKAPAGGTPTAPANSGAGTAPAGGAVVEPVAPVAKTPAGGAVVEPVAPVAKAPAGGTPTAPANTGAGTAPAGGAVVEPVAPVAKAPGGAVVEPVPGTQTAPGQPVASAVVTAGMDAVAALKVRNAEIARTLTGLEGQTSGAKGFFRRFFLQSNASKQVETLKSELAQNQAKLQQLETNPELLAKANAEFQGNSKVQNALGQQSKLIQAYQAELAKVDPNSSYGKALNEKIGQLQGTAPETFAHSLKNMFVVAAGTNILMSLGRQIKNGEKVDLGEAVKSVANPAFLVGTAGTAAGAFLASKLVLQPAVSLILTRVGSFLPPIGQVFVNLLPAFLGGALGGSLAGSLLGQKPDWALVMSQTLGAALGTAIVMQMFPGLGMVGQIAGGMIGGWIAEKILHMFRGDPKSETPGAEGEGADKTPPTEVAEDPDAAKVTGYTEGDLQSTFDNMTASYQKYLQAEKGGKLAEAATAYQEYIKHKHMLDAYRGLTFRAGTTQASASAPARPAPGAAPATPQSGKVQ